MENTSGTDPKLIEENSLLKQKIKELEEYKAKFNEVDRALWKNDSFYYAFLISPWTLWRSQILIMVA